MAEKRPEKRPVKAAKAPGKPSAAGKTQKKAVRGAVKASGPVLRNSKPVRTAEKRSTTAKKAPAPVKSASSSARKQRGQGQLERIVRSDLREAERTSPAHNSLAQLAYTLARQLDDGAGMATAAVSKELRATLNQLVGGGDDVDEELKRFIASVSAEVGNPAQPG